MSPDERRFASESMEDIAADNMASDRYGAWGSPGFQGDHDPPPFS
jgi:hypothetical protein